MDYWDSIIIILLLVAQIIIMCLKLFGKSFVKTLGTNIADLVTTRTKTKIEENVKQGFRSALEEHKALLNKKNKVYEIDYSLFKQKSFDTMIELYSKLAIFQGCAYQYTNLFISAGQDVEKTMKQRKDNYQESYHNLRNYIIHNKLLIEEELFEKISKAIEKINSQCIEFEFQNQIICSSNFSDDQKSKAYSRLAEISESIPIEQKEIETDIRITLFPDAYM